MAVSTLLNDITLTAAADRAIASKKAQPKTSNLDFDAALSETRKGYENAREAKQRLDISKPESRNEAKTDSSRDDRFEAKPEPTERANSPREDVREPRQSDRRDDDKAASNSKTPAPKQKTTSESEPVAQETGGKEKQPSSDTEKAATTEAKQIDASAVTQPAAVIQTAPIETQAIQLATQPVAESAIPAELQTAVLLNGAKATAQQGAETETSSEGADAIGIDGKSKSVGVNAAAILPNATAQTEASSAKEAKTESTPIQLNAQELAAVKAVKQGAKEAENTSDVKAATPSLDPLASQSNQAKPAQDTSFVEQLKTQTSAQADKSAAGISGITPTGPSITAETTQLIKASATPSEAMARADAPVPMQAVAVEIGMRAMRGSKEFSIRLDPEDLGRIDIKLEISEAGEVQAKLMVERVETLHLLQRDAKTLERAFDQAGLKSNPDGLQFSLKDPGQQNNSQQRDGQQEQRSDRSNKNAFDADTLTIEDTSIRTFRYSSAATSGLDIRI
jgi:flagellar hook-length control protein FliK